MSLKAISFAAAFLVIGFLLMPTGIIAVMSIGRDEYLQFPPRGFTLNWYLVYLTDPDWRAATMLSLRVAGITALSSTVIGTFAALALVRGKPIAATAIRMAILAPTIVPNIITAIAVYYLFSNLNITGTLVGFVGAHTILATPIAFLCVYVQLQNFDPQLEMAALSLGASRLTAFKEVTLPMIRPSILVGAVFAFLASFDEAVISFFISGAQEKTLPRKMFEDIDFDVSPALAAIATLVTLATMFLLALPVLVRRGAKRGKGIAQMPSPST